MDINKMTLEAKKAVAYDASMEIYRLQNLLKQINVVIAQEIEATNGLTETTGNQRVTEDEAKATGKDTKTEE